MKLKMFPATLSNAPLKAISLIAGYTFWHIFGSITTTCVWVTVPLCFYTTDTRKKIEAPETINVQLQGKRAHLYAINKQSLAAHVNGNSLKAGNHNVILTAHNLFLPESIKLVHYMPSTIHITVQQTE